MLSSFLLTPADAQAREHYERSRTQYYKTVYPLVTFLVLCLAVTIEVIYRVDGGGGGERGGDLHMQTSIVNWLGVALGLMLSLVIRKYEWAWMNHLMCPLLTVLVFYYLTFFDLTPNFYNPRTLYFLMMIESPTQFLLAFAFSE
jgi:hypothetical protein